MAAARPVLVLLAATGLVGVASCGMSASQPAAQAGGADSAPAPPVGAGVVEGGRLRPDHAAPANRSPYSPDEGGARAAAVDFTLLAEDLLAMDERGAVWARREIAAAGTADRQVAQLQAELRALQERWPPGTLTYRVAPLATRATADRDGGYRVDVWYVGIVSGRGFDTYAEWITDTYDLVWERDSWRIAAMSETDGPRPAPARQAVASAAEFEARLDGFEAVR